LRLLPDQRHLTGVTRAPTLTLVELLCSTLKQVERSVELRPDDPALRDLQHYIVHLIAELEIEKSRAA
jgi:hypothetical protein